LAVFTLGYTLDTVDGSKWQKWRLKYEIFSFENERQSRCWPCPNANCYKFLTIMISPIVVLLLVPSPEIHGREAYNLNSSCT
jgi:hypothetical protein